MISIRKFLGHDEKFYDLLEASAQQADSSVHHGTPSRSSMIANTGIRRNHRRRDRWCPAT